MRLSILDKNKAWVSQIVCITTMAFYAFSFSCINSESSLDEDEDENPLFQREASNNVYALEQDPQTSNQRILAIALDADGCFFHKKCTDAWYHQPASDVQGTRGILDATAVQYELFHFNRHLLAHISNIMQSQAYEHICFLIGSWRQDEALDAYNATKNHTPLFFDIMPMLVTKLKQQHPALRNKIYFDPFLISEAIQDDLPDAQDTYPNPSQQLYHAISNAPRAKMLIVRYHEQHLKYQFHNRCIDYVAYDDKPHLYNLFALRPAKNPQFNFKLYHYSGGEPYRMIANVPPRTRYRQHRWSA